MLMKEEEIKDRLMSSNREFRQLAAEHHDCEAKLADLLKHHPMTEQDHLEEVRLKKRKLHLKDQMTSMMQQLRNQLSHQAS